MKVALALLGLSAVLAVQGASAMEALRVHALRSGEVLIDGAPATLASLNARLAKIKADNGVVFYFREQPGQDPTTRQWEIFKAIVDAKVPIRLSTKPDFSDAVVPNP
jgi:hypothetical protein